MKSSRKGNPFQTYDAPFSNTVGGGPSPFTATRTSGTQEAQRRQEQSNSDPVAVSLPPHIYMPETAQSVDLRRAMDVVDGAIETLIDFTAPRSGVTRFFSYALYTTATDFTEIAFVPTVNGRRIFPYHGDPQENYKIALGTSGDLGNNSLINGLLTMNPGDRLVWTFQNNTGLNVIAGVRMVGYFDQEIVRKINRFGG